MAGHTVISKFAGLLLTAAEPIETTWDAWLEQLATEPTALYSTTTGGWSAAEFDPPERAKANVVRVHGLVLDYDKDANWDRVHEAWRTANGLIYTTKSHSDLVTRLRVVMPFLRPVSVAEYERIWTWAAARSQGKFKVPVDRQCKDASRYWYDPTKPPGGWRAERFTGQVLDPDKIIARMDELEAPRLAVVRQPMTTPFASTEEKVRRARGYLAQIPGAIQGQEGNRATFKAVSAVLRGFDLSVADAERIILEDYNPRCVPPWSEYDINRMVVNCDEKGDTPRGYLLNEMSHVMTSPTESRHTLSGMAPQPVPPQEATPENWRTLTIKKPDNFTSTRDFENVRIFVRAHPDYAGKWSMDERDGTVWFDGKKTTDTTIVADIRSKIAREMRFTPAVADTEMAIHCAAFGNKFHPVRRYLESLTWDGVPRLDSMASDYLGATQPGEALWLRKFMIGAASRAMTPGEKLDTTLILYGEEGLMKSTFFDVIGGEWYRDTAVDYLDKDDVIKFHKSWIYELAELDYLLGLKNNSRIKAFLSSRNDSYRAPYARDVVEHPRSFVICGTTNRKNFIVSDTGTRRYWVVTITKNVPINELRGARDQLWAEAVHAFRSGEIWYLTPEEDVVRADANRQYMRTDSWLDDAASYLAGRTNDVSVSELLLNALKVPVENHDPARQGRARAIFAELGWENVRIRVPGASGSGSLKWSYRKKL